MEHEIKTMLEDVECEHCNAEIPKGAIVYIDAQTRAVFCSEAHWEFFYEQGDEGEEYDI